MSAALLPPVSQAFIVQVKRSFVEAYDENDELLISNLGALKWGLRALAKEDAENWDVAAKLWKEAQRLLAVEQANDIGASAEGTIQTDDSFFMEAFPIGL
jgi:hypothetical protein